MSAELGLIAGLGIIAYMLVEIAEEIEDSETEINQGIFVLSMIFIIGLEYTGYGIAKTGGYSNAETAYLAALLVTMLSFIGIIAQFANNLLDKTREEDALESL